MTDKENPPSADAPDPVGEDKGQFVGPTTSAMQELATILSSDRELTPEDLREKPVELESERADAPIDYSVIIPASVLIAIVVAWGLLSGDTFSAAAKVAFSWVLDNLGWAFSCSSARCSWLSCSPLPLGVSVTFVLGRWMNSRNSARVHGSR
ncbi:hypothetical protein [Dermatophilus congolensis]|uniref:hypothetical protein n=1 Tax=Dermatophilus congolensis TaxID=1863 RepID=UPI0027D1EEDD|nr:hypothetical protein [Dermatophilus congolensis]